MFSTLETIPASRSTSIAERTSVASTYPHDSSDNTSDLALSPSNTETTQSSQPRGPAGHRAQSIVNMIYLTFHPRACCPFVTGPRSAGSRRTIETGYDRAGRTAPVSDPGATVHAMSRTTDSSPRVEAAVRATEPLLRVVPCVGGDPETAGTRSGADESTEIGAVRVRGGEVLAELPTFVSIRGSLPPQISRLTGIAPEDLVGAPALGEVMATFFEFSRGAVLVAHNAG